MKLGDLKDKKTFMKGLGSVKLRKPEHLSVGLVWISAFLGVLILVKVGVSFVGSASAKRLVEDTLAQSQPDPNDREKYFAKPRAIADELKKGNLFVPAKPKKHPVNQVSGILGSEALINGKWYKVGDKVGDAKIVAIEPARVKIEWDGQEKVFAPINASGPSKAAGPEKKEREKGEKAGRRGRRRQRAAEEQPETETGGATTDEDPLAWMGVELSATVRAKLLEHWNKASDEEKQKMKEQWNKLSDEQKQKTVESMEENM